MIQENLKKVVKQIFFSIKVLKNLIKFIKPEETRIISATSGVYSSKTVANKIIQSIKVKNIYLKYKWIQKNV